MIDEDSKEEKPSLRKPKATPSPSNLNEETQGEGDQAQTVECQICAFPYDKNIKIPRILPCGHTFCETCLEEIRRQRGPEMISIQCPNCRNVTQVVSIGNLPENEFVFQKEPQMFTMNIFSPYEAAKRLGMESKSLVETSERYMQFLYRLRELDSMYEGEITKNFEKEFHKVEQYKKVMMKIITDYTEGVKQKLTD